MSVWTGKRGEKKDCIVQQEVLALYWSRTRARPGEKVKLGAIVKDVKDGKKVSLEIKTDKVAIKTLDDKLQGGKCEVEWTIELPQRDDWPHDIPLVFDVVVDEKIRSGPGQRVTL